MEHSNRAKAIIGQIAGIDSSIESLNASRKELVEELISMGLAGENVPSVRGDFVGIISTGKSFKLEDDKARECLGDKYNEILEKKQKDVTLTVSDLKKAKIKEAIIMTMGHYEDGTVKVTIKKA